MRATSLDYVSYERTMVACMKVKNMEIYTMEAVGREDSGREHQESEDSRYIAILSTRVPRRL